MTGDAPSALEDRILALAAARSLLTPGQAATPAPPPTGAERWGPRLDRMVAEGLLSEGLVEALAWEAERSTAGATPLAPDSWVQPTLGSIFPAGPADPDLEAWGRYRDLQLLAQGGAGKVYSALDPVLRRRVALKLLRTALPGHAERLLAEARAQARVDHPHVCRIYEAGEVGGRPYISMQLVVGRTLAQCVDRLGLRQRVEVLRQVAEAVHAAHRLGLVHLDLKPGNVLVEFLEGGRPHPYVTDFGLVAEEGPRDLQGPVGTPPFASPEQLSGSLHEVDRRSDVYGLGATLYALACGRLPFDATDPEALVRATLHEAPVPLRHRDPELPEDLAWIVARCMARDRGRRYGSALALAEDLQRFLDGEPVHARPRTPSYRAAAWIRRHRALASVAAAALAAVVAVAGYGLAVNRRAAARARLAGHFGQRVEQVRALLRYAHLRAPHDLRPELATVRATMDGLRSDMDRAGGAGLGPGQHALGRAQLALGRPREALALLRGALASGERSPDLHADLGLALGLLYARGLKESQGLSQPALRAQRLAALERDFKLPALEHLRRGRGAGPEGAFGEALVAAFEGRAQEALARTRAVLDRSPWFYEALLLEVQLGLTASMVRNPLEERAQARDLGHLDRVGATAARLLHLAPSLPEAYFLESDRWHERGRILEATGGPAALEAFRTGLAWADRGLALDPDHPDLLIARSRHLWILGEKAQQSGGDPGPSFREARSSADRAAVLEPDRGYVHRNRANVLAAQAAWAASTGGDPAEAVDAGLAALQRALDLDGRDLPGLRTLAWLQGFRADALRHRRQDPRPAWRAALAAYTEVLAQVPGDPMASANGGLMHGLLFEMDLEEGGGDPAVLERGLALLAEGTGRSPRNAAAWSNRVFLARLGARRARESGQDPEPWLARGREDARRAQEVATTDAGPWYEHGGLELEAARCALARGLDPAPALARAEAAFLEAGRRNPKETDAWRGRAEAVLVRSERPGARVGAPALSAAVRLAERALELNPSNTPARLVLGALHLQRARAGDPAAARPAAAALAKALDEAPECRRTWGPRLEEARRRGGGS